MKKITLKKIFLPLAFCFFSFSLAAIPAITVSKVEPSWTTVLNGNVLCQPVRNSFGYVTVDEGKIVCLINEEGTVLWQRRFTSRLKPLISVGEADLLYLISRDGDLNLLNPGGLLLWTSRTGFSVTEAPLPGRDGRVFVRGSENIACYSIRGNCKWNVSLKEQNTSIPITELNDGSLLVFLNKTVDGKSVGVTLNPFGAMSEEIIFAGKVVDAKTLSTGVALSFADGSVGLCSEKKGETYSRWAIRAGTGGLGNTACELITEGVTDEILYVLSGNSGSIIGISADDGTILFSFKTQYTAFKTIFRGMTNQGLVLASPALATCYDEEGSAIWEAKLDSEKKWNFVFPTDSGYLALCTNDWVIEAFRLRQTPGENTQKESSFSPKKISFYSVPAVENYLPSSDLNGRAISLELEKKMRQGFLKGAKAQDEQSWLFILQNELENLTSDWIMGAGYSAVREPYFVNDITYSQTVVRLCALSGNTAFVPYFANLISRVQNRELLLTLISCVKDLAFDSDGEVLKALYKRANTMRRDAPLLQEICDANFNICRAMGRPSFFNQGRELLMLLMGSQYSKTTQVYARKTLEKFLQIKL